MMIEGGEGSFLTGVAPGVVEVDMVVKYAVPQRSKQMRLR